MHINNDLLKRIHLLTLSIKLLVLEYKDCEIVQHNTVYTLAVDCY